MLTLYHSPGSSSMAAHIALHEIGAPFESGPFICQAGTAHGGLPRGQSRRQGTDPADRRAPADRSRRDPLLSRQALPRGRPVAGGRHRGEAQAISWMSFIASTIHPARRIGVERWWEVFEIAERRLNGRDLDRRSLLDRRHPPVSPVLAICRFGQARARGIPSSVGPLRPDDGASSGSPHARDRRRDRCLAAIANDGPTRRATTSGIGMCAVRWFGIGFALIDLRPSPSLRPIAKR